MEEFFRRGGSGGFFAYESIVHSIDITKSSGGNQDFLYLHEDMIWKQSLLYENKLSRISSISLQTSATWHWINLRIGLSAYQIFLREFGTSQDTIPDEQHVFAAQSDFFIIKHFHAGIFRERASQMRKHNVFLEIAIPYLFKMLPEQEYSDNLHLSTTWDSSRGN